MNTSKKKSPFDGDLVVKTNTERFLDVVSKYKCRELFPAHGKITPESQEVRRQTIKLGDVGAAAGIKIWSTLSTIAQREADKCKIIKHRFMKDGTYVAEEEFDIERKKESGKYAGVETRVGVLSRENIFVGEDDLRTMGGAFLGDLNTLGQISVMTGSPELNEPSIRLHFTIGLEMFHIVISKHLIDSGGTGRPLVLFLGQHSVVDRFNYCYYAEQNHIDIFGDRVLYLTLPTPSLRVPCKMGVRFPFTGEGSSTYMPDLGNNALIFYPGMKKAWLLHLSGRWLPEFADLSKSEGRSAGVRELLKFETWVRQGGIWPESISPLNRFQPPQMAPIRKDIVPKWNEFEDSGLLKTKLVHPTIFEVQNWLRLSEAVQGGEGNINSVTESQSKRFKRYIASQLTEIQLPTLLKFRHFHMMVTN